MFPGAGLTGRVQEGELSSQRQKLFSVHVSETDCFLRWVPEGLELVNRRDTPQLGLLKSQLCILQSSRKNHNKTLLVN